MAEPTSPTPQAQPFVFNGVKIDALLQDLITIRADAVVNSAGTMEPIDMSRGLSAVLRQAGGKFAPTDPIALARTDDVVKYDLQKHGPGPFPSGSVVVTTAGLLPQVKYLFHAIIIVWGREPRVTEDDVRAATAECIRLANALRLRSIALPALGTGLSGRADQNRIAPAMVDTLFRCLEEKTTLEEVHFFGKQAATIDAFFQAILAARDATPRVKAFAQAVQRNRRWPVLMDLKPKGADGPYEVELADKAGLAVELNRSDVVQLNRAFIKALNNILRAVRQARSSKLEDKVLESLAMDLCAAGQQVFNATFKPGSQIRKDIAGLLSDAQKAGRPLAWEARSSAVNDFPLIWEMLYNAGDAKPAPDNRFGTEMLWGVQFAIARQITGTARGIFDPYIMEPEKGGGMLLLVNDGLKSANTLEGPGLIELAKARGIPCRRIDSLLTKTNPVLEDILDALADDVAGYDFVHFACHVKPADNATETKLIITINEKTVAVTLGDLEGHGLLWEKSHPLVFLNACESGEPPEFQSRTLVKYFLDRGARGVIATQCLMPDIFASGFALRFYEHFFRGLPIDQALLEARRACLAQDNNPLGLAYTVYANPLAQIEWAATS